MKDKLTQKRIIFNVDPKVHKRIKMIASQNNCTLTKYIMGAIYSRMNNEDETNGKYSEFKIV